ncbi:MAG: hypothetical protein EXS31_14845 [Pedosphaera sp.]|nr:hypothetical protein [Pedosphaera sp.]
MTAIAVVLSACHKQDPVVELEKAAAAMEKVEATPAAPDTGPDPAPAGPPPAKQVKEALADYKAGKMEDAVTRLQLLRAMPAMPPQQRMALQDSIAAVMTEIYTLAEKGDPRAIAAVVQYEKMQNAR